MNEKQNDIKVNYKIWQGIKRKYFLTFFLLIIALVLLYFLHGIWTFSIFLSFIFIFILYLVFRGNWLFEINEMGIISGSLNRHEQIEWKDLQYIIIELDQEQIYLRSGENSRLVNYQMILSDEVELVKKALHHFANKHEIKIEEMKGLKNQDRKSI